MKSQPNFIAEQREVYHNIRPSDRVHYERVINWRWGLPFSGAVCVCVGACGAVQLWPWAPAGGEGGALAPPGI